MKRQPLQGFGKPTKLFEAEMKQQTERKVMHYKNGREAKNGDKVVLLPSYGAPMVGILYDAVANNDTCNGKLAACAPNDPMPNLAECLHIDDVIAADKAKLITDCTKL